MPRFRKRALQSGLLLFGIASVLAAFVRERRVAAPMLPVSFFSSPSFTVASVGVGLVFFAMMGSVFAFTLAGTAGHVFTEALDIGLAAAAAVVALAGGLLVLLRLPSGRAPATTSTAARPHPTPTAQPVTP